MCVALTTSSLIVLTSTQSVLGLEDFSLSMPLKCQPGETCFVQNYVDIDPSSAVGDYACGYQTYDGHKGTDFRLLSTTAAEDSVPVVAAAAGVVLAFRDAMPDRLIARRNDPQTRNLECGNGVLLDHGSGWQTQYCHMHRGSLRVKRGERVKRGQVLGEVGYSGVAQFAHLHFEVRRNGQFVDPFAPDSKDNHCNQTSKRSLWLPTVLRSFAYSKGQLIETGFSGAPVTAKDLERGKVTAARSDAEALLFYARFINLSKGDRIQLELTGPGGLAVNHNSKPLNRNKAQWISFAGRKLRRTAWPRGQYRGIVRLVRGGKIALERSQIEKIE